MPKCTHNAYIRTIADLDAGKGLGEPVGQAEVGNNVVHRWHCDGDDIDGVFFRNCYVSDGEIHLADVVDQHGCSMDPLLIADIRRSSDQKTTYMEAATFKFAGTTELWYLCEAQTCNNGVCGDVVPMTSCYSTLPLEKEQALSVPSESLPQPAPTPDMDAEIDAIMKARNGSYQPAFIVSGRITVPGSKHGHAGLGAILKANKEQNEDGDSSQSTVGTNKDAVGNGNDSKSTDPKPTEKSTSNPAQNEKLENTDIDDEKMEHMTYGRPLSGTALVMLIIGLGVLLVLSASAAFILLYRKFERVLHCGNHKPEYPM
ncbi:unnamed protein product [Bursaphelenchus okinawaensis]|uniref:ZP domain-containing protein n=1 Tax=Bursaphelenchus okinawaensis TaxID=465554 RepID=A0A811JWE6_9BILA|nr:unnamed protein product [Bursaphelenchus okinawaensis]CAG9086057.1 unnamed protein product [Bursaphelenchus okinawaensis]